MGWTYGNDWRTKNDIIEHCTQVSKSLTKLDHAVRGNNLWLLLQVNEGERKGDIFVTLMLLQKDDGIYGYKDFDDTSQPYHYNCPIGFIKRTVASGRTANKRLVYKCIFQSCQHNKELSCLLKPHLNSCLKMK